MKAKKRGEKPPHLSLLCHFVQGFLRNLKKLKKKRRLIKKALLFGIKKTPYSKVLLSQFILATFLTSNVFGDSNNFQNQPKGTAENQISIQSIKAEEFPFEIKKPLVKSALSQDYVYYHQAIDLATDYGESITPIGPGKVEEVGYDPYGKGEIVIVDHGSNIRSLYAHLGKIDVEKGEEVKDDTVLGVVGLTGHTTGSHLHLEIYEGQEMLDPKDFVPKEEYSVKL